MYVLKDEYQNLNKNIDLSPRRQYPSFIKTSSQELHNLFGCIRIAPFLSNKGLIHFLFLFRNFFYKFFKYIRRTIMTYFRAHLPINQDFHSFYTLKRLHLKYS
jgi:hypothetical protein